ADDVAIASKDTAVTIAVLANDSDIDGDTLSTSIATGPAHGTATANSGGTVTYTPASGFTGLDEIGYTVADGHGGTAPAQVTVLVYETGQWASSVIAASSQYDPGDSSTDWAASQALGAPDTF